MRSPDGGFDSTTLLILLQLAILPIVFQNSGHRWSGMDVSGFLVNLSEDHVYPSDFFQTIEKIVWTLSKDLTSLETHRYSNNHQCASPARHPNSYELFWLRQCITVEKEMIPLSASKVWLGVLRDGGIWSLLTWTKNHWSLHRHPEMSLEVVVETLLQESQYYFLLELVDAVPKWMFSILDLLQGFWFVHLRLENWLLLVWEISTLSHWDFWGISDASIVSNSSSSVISTSPFQIPTS